MGQKRRKEIPPANSDCLAPGDCPVISVFPASLLQGCGRTTTTSSHHASQHISLAWSCWVLMGATGEAWQRCEGCRKSWKQAFSLEIPATAGLWIFFPISFLGFSTRCWKYKLQESDNTNSTPRLKAFNTYALIRPSDLCTPSGEEARCPLGWWFSALGRGTTRSMLGRRQWQNLPSRLRNVSWTIVLPPSILMVQFPEQTQDTWDLVVLQLISCVTSGEPFILSVLKFFEELWVTGR